MPVPVPSHENEPGKRPLAGKRVVVTRPERQAAGMIAALGALGAEPVEFPAIRIVEPADAQPLARAAREAERYDWVVFTSVNGVERFWAELERQGRDGDVLSAARFACIGPATADALRRRGYEPAVVPDEYVAEGLVEAMLDAAGDPERADLSGVSILLPRAAGAREVLPRRLAEAGAEVLEVEAYRAAPDLRGAEALRRRLDAGEIDVVTFTSSSTVESFVDALGADAGGALVAAIGPITAGTAEELGLTVAVVADEHTVAGLIGALVEHYT